MKTRYQIKRRLTTQLKIRSAECFSTKRIIREAVSPLKTECQVVGIYTDEITPLFLSRETEISIGRKKMTIDKAQNALNEAIRTLNKLDKKASAIKETSKRVVEVIREEEQQRDQVRRNAMPSAWRRPDWLNVFAYRIILT